MKHREHYIELLLAHPGQQHSGASIPITIQKLTAVLNCTARNVKLVLRRLAEDGYMEWRAGVGRGHISHMAVVRGLEEVLTEYVGELLEKGRMKEALDWATRQGMNPPFRGRLRLMLEKQMGFQLKQTGTSELDVLRVTVARKLGIFDPAFSYTATEVFLLEQIYSRLVDFDSVGQRFLPSLAHAWESNEDYTVWTFYLRKGVRFHHGLIFTAEDVRHTLERLREVRSPSCWQYEDIAEAEVAGEYCLVLRLKKPNPFLLHFFSCATMSIIPHDEGFSEQKMLGTGAFKVAENAAQVLRLEAFDDYFRERAWLDIIEIWHIPSDSPGDRQFSLPHSESVAGETDTDAKRDMDSMLDGCRYLIFNFNQPGIQHNPGFRQAMRLLLNRKLLVTELGDPRSMPANSFLVARSKKEAHESNLFAEREKHHRENDSLPDARDLLESDSLSEAREDLLEGNSLSEAGSLLRESGYAGETISLYYHGRPVELQDMLWLRRRALAIGLQLELKPYSFAQYTTQRLGQHAQMMLATEVLEKDTELGLLRLFFNEDSNFHHFFNEEQLGELRSILASYVSVESLDERAKIIDEAEGLLRRDNWLLYLYHTQFRTRLPHALQGLAHDSFGWLDFSKLWIKP
ncbi:ABC transporter substrate-binding protein [Paenibacillus sp. CAU 1782]